MIGQDRRHVLVDMRQFKYRFLEWLCRVYLRSGLITRCPTRWRITTMEFSCQQKSTTNSTTPLWHPHDKYLQMHQGLPRLQYPIRRAKAMDIGNALPDPGRRGLRK